jgi:hypothetical protein
MAKDSKEKSAKPSLKEKKRLDISAVAVIDNMVFSKTEKWAYYRLTTQVFDFLSTNGKVQIGLQISNALNAIMGERKDPLDCHLIITSVPVDVDSWAAQVRRVAEGWEQPEGFNNYIEEQIHHLKQNEYLKKVTYLGVNLGKRGALETEDFNVFENGIKGAGDILKNWWNSATQAQTEEVSATEEVDTRKKENGLFTSLSTGHLKASRCTSEELLLLIKRQFYPNMPAPYLDIDHENRVGPGDLDLELYSGIKNKYRWMEFSQMLDEEEVTGYRACLTFSKFPKFVDYPNQGFPFFYFPSKLLLPFTCYSRFTLHPSSKMKKDLAKKKQEQQDEVDNVQAGNSSTTGAPAEVVDAIQDLSLIENMLAQDKTPWVEGTYRIVVETHTEELLRKYCTIVKQSYADLDINVNWTVGDQAELFLEQMPGDRLRGGSFKQISNLVMLATSGFNFSSDVGDPIFGNDGEMG